jgi:hypothetical protein
MSGKALRNIISGPLKMFHKAHPQNNVVPKIMKFSELLSLSETQVMIVNSRLKEAILGFGIGSSL